MSSNEPGVNENQSPENTPSSVTAMDRETRQWAMFIHFSILAGWVIPIAGLIIPILLWQMKKEELPGIVPHAHVVLNWIVTSLVYGVICFILIVLSKHNIILMVKYFQS